MSYYGEFSEYVPVAEKRKMAQKAIEKLKKKNPSISPVVIEGRKIAKTWWGKSWNDNLESYADYSNRIGRGRSYVRNGAVLDLKINVGTITALVQGSTKKPYKVEIKIKPISKEIWKEIEKECAGKIHSLEELMAGKFPKALSDLFTAKGKGLFPTPKEITMECSCPDWADMCKHIAAVLYGVGVRLDDNPALFFTLRNVNIDDLIKETVHKKSQQLLEKSETKSHRMLDDSDIMGMFGIDVEIEAEKVEIKRAKRKKTSQIKNKKIDASELKK